MVLLLLLPCVDACLWLGSCQGFGTCLQGSETLGSWQLQGLGFTECQPGVAQTPAIGR
jgi:hypothetical protein